MLSPHDRSFGKSGGKAPDSPRDTSPANSYKTAEQEHQASERIEHLKQVIKSLRVRSLSCSIKIGKLKTETPRDDELIRELQKKADLLRGMVIGDEEEVKWLEAEIEKEQKERNDELLRSLTDTLPPKVGAWSAETGDGGGGGAAGGMGSIDAVAERVDDFP